MNINFKHSDNMSEMNTETRVKKVVEDIEAELLEKFGPIQIIKDENDFDFDGASEYSMEQSKKYEGNKKTMEYLEELVKEAYWKAKAEQFSTLKWIISCIPKY